MQFFVQQSSEIRSIISKVFPEYNGKKDVAVVPVRDGTVTRINTAWDGGYRSLFAVLPLEHSNNAYRFPSDLGSLIKPCGEYRHTSGYVLFELRQGGVTPEKITIYSCDNDLPATLNPCTDNELSTIQKIVLGVTIGLKGSYNGDPNYRYNQSFGYQRYKALGVTLADFQRHQSLLTDQGYLRKVGKGLSGTTKGKNEIYGKGFSWDNALYKLINS